MVMVKMLLPRLIQLPEGNMHKKCIWEWFSPNLQWSKNSNSPRIPTQARVVTKRMYTSGGAGDTSASTSYYITFEFLTGVRKEFYVPYREYGLIAEGDDGIFTFQGSRFISFERNNQQRQKADSWYQASISLICELEKNILSMVGCGIIALVIETSTHKCCHRFCR